MPSPFSTSLGQQQQQQRTQQQSQPAAQQLGRGLTPPPSPASAHDPSNTEFAVKADQIAHQVYRKTVSLVTYSRLTRIPGNKGRADRWYNLDVDDTDIFREELKQFRTLSRLQTAPPKLYIDVILDAADLPLSHALVISSPSPSIPRRVSASNNRPSVVLERWSIDLAGATSTSQSSTTAPLSSGSTNPLQSQRSSTSELPSVYKHAILLCRTILALATTLPAYALVRRLRRHQEDGLRIGCRLQMASSIDKPLSEIPVETPLFDEQPDAVTREFECAPLRTPIGTFVISCTYRTNVAFSSQGLESMLSSRFFADNQLAGSFNSRTSRSARPTSPATTSGAFVGAAAIPMASLPSGQGSGPGSSLPRYSTSPRFTLASSPAGYGPSSSLRYTAPGSYPQSNRSFEVAKSSSHSSSPSFDRASEGSTSSKIGIPTGGSAPRPFVQPVQRYSSSKYGPGRSFTSGSPGSPIVGSLEGTSPLQQPVWGPESLGRRSRLSAMTLSSEDVDRKRISIASVDDGERKREEKKEETRERTESSDTSEINTLLSLIDSLPNLRLDSEKQKQRSIQKDAEKQLDALASSVLSRDELRDRRLSTASSNIGEMTAEGSSEGGRAISKPWPIRPRMESWSSTGEDRGGSTSSPSNYGVERYRSTGRPIYRRSRNVSAETSEGGLWWTKARASGEYDSGESMSEAGPRGSTETGSEQYEEGAAGRLDLT